MGIFSAATIVNQQQQQQQQQPRQQRQHRYPYRRLFLLLSLACIGKLFLPFEIARYTVRARERESAKKNKSSSYPGCGSSHLTFSIPSSLSLLLLYYQSISVFFFFLPPRSDLIGASLCFDQQNNIVGKLFFVHNLLVACCMSIRPRPLFLPL